jgi:hypothetical protein
MSAYSRGEQTLQKNIYGLVFLLYSVTYIANHATAIFSLKGVPKEILHYSGEVVLILCAVGYEAFGMMSKGRATDGSDLFTGFRSCSGSVAVPSF